MLEIARVNEPPINVPSPPGIYASTCRHDNGMLLDGVHLPVYTMQTLIAESVARHFGHELPVMPDKRPIGERIDSRLASAVDRINERRLRRGEAVLTAEEIELMAARELK